MIDAKHQRSIQFQDSERLNDAYNRKREAVTHVTCTQRSGRHTRYNHNIST